MTTSRAVKPAWRDGGRALVIVRSFVERARSSLFTIPVVWIAGAIGLAQLVTWIDVRTQQSDALPSFLDTTVESSRALLGAISSGTIGAASVVFSLTLVAIQMSSSVYTSRVLRSFLRDRFQQNMIGVLLATFTYSLLVLREVRGPLEDSADSFAYIPRLSAFLAVLFAIAAVLALLASISHTAQSLRASAVTSDLVGDLVDLIEKTLPERDAHDDNDTDNETAAPPTSASEDPVPTEESRRGHPDHPGAVLTADQRGWVQQISLEAICDAIDRGSSVHLEVSAGSYVADGMPLLKLWPPPPPEELESLMKNLRGAFGIGQQRSLQQDIVFGFIMIEDIANKALSPGVNDPNTAAAVIQQLGEAVLCALERDPLPATLSFDDRELTRASITTHDDIVVAAFNQIRHYSVGQPTVQLAMVRTLVVVGDELIRRRRDTDEALEALRSMLRLVEGDLTAADQDPTAKRARELITGVSWYEARTSSSMASG